MQPSFLGSPLLSTARCGGGEEKTEISGLSAVVRHTVHSKEETIMDTSCLQHSQTSLCKIKAARKLPPRHRSQIKHGKAGPADSPRSTGAPGCAQGWHLPARGWMQPDRSSQCNVPGNPAESILRERHLEEVTLTPPKLFSLWVGKADLSDFSLQPHLSTFPAYVLLVAWLGFSAAHSNEHLKMQTISQLQLPPHS